MNICRCVCMYVLYAYIRVCMHLCVYACMYICMHVCIPVCIYVIFNFGFERYGGIVLVERRIVRGNCPGKCPCPGRTGHPLSSTADWPIIGPDGKCCRCIGQALLASTSKYLQ